MIPYKIEASVISGFREVSFVFVSLFDEDCKSENIDVYAHRISSYKKRILNNITIIIIRIQIQGHVI